MSRKNNSKELEKTGKDIYRNKPTFKRPRDSKEFGDAQFVTWSQEEYANLGLQRQYLKLKSYQRFTEAWSLLERADARGLCFLFLILDDYYFYLYATTLTIDFYICYFWLLLKLPGEFSIPVFGRIYFFIFETTTLMIIFETSTRFVRHIPPHHHHKIIAESFENCICWWWTRIRAVRMPGVL
jgi:hypothetical protein